MANKVRTEVKRDVKKARAAAKKAFALAKIKFRDAEKQVNKHIKQDPDKALLLAAGVGAAIGAATAFALSHKRRQ